MTDRGTLDQLSRVGAGPTPGRVRYARYLCWVGVVLPFIYATPRMAPELSGSTLSYLDLIRGVGPLFALVLAILCSAPRRRGHSAVEIWLLVFCMLALASALWTRESSTVVSLKALQLGFVYVILLRLVRLYDTPTEGMRGLASVVHVVLGGVMLQLVLTPMQMYSADSIGSEARLSATYPSLSPNVLAILCLAGLGSIFFKVGPEWIMRSLPVRSVLVPVYFFMLLETGSRSATAIGILGMAIAAGRNLRRRPGPIFVGLGALLFLMLSIGNRLWASILEFARRGQSTEQIQNLTGRTEIWRLGLNASEDDRLLGLGYFAGHRVGIPGLPLGQSNLDSTWIETVVDLGILGLIPLILFVALGAVRFATSSCRDHALHWGLFLMFVGISVSFVNPTVQTPGPTLVLLAFPLLIGFNGDYAAAGAPSRVHAKPHSAIG